MLAKGYIIQCSKEKPHTRQSTLRVLAEYRATTADSMTNAYLLSLGRSLSNE